jgi:ADP-ribose pyrophosphatase YjhB (NUDIX family)
VNHGGRVLLIRRATEPWRGCWDIPGGFCELDEHPRLTAEREVFEETGLRTTVTGLLGIWMDRYGEGEDAEATLNVYYHAVPAQPDVAASLNADAAEVAEIGWFAPDSLPRDQAFPEHQLAVLDAWVRASRAGATATRMWDASGAAASGPPSGPGRSTRPPSAPSAG